MMYDVWCMMYYYCCVYYCYYHYHSTDFTQMTMTIHKVPLFNSIYIQTILYNSICIQTILNIQTIHKWLYTKRLCYYTTSALSTVHNCSKVPLLIYNKCPWCYTTSAHGTIQHVLLRILAWAVWVPGPCKFVVPAPREKERKRGWRGRESMFSPKRWFPSFLYKWFCLLVFYKRQMCEAPAFSEYEKVNPFLS